MKPMTSRIATGSLKPLSPSSVLVRRVRSVESRSTAKIAALSVAEMIAPTRKPSSRERSKITTDAAPATSAVASVPTVASETAGKATGLISGQPAASPPSKRISDSAMIPATWAAW